ncbi:galactosylgalactosylxylosylprotein 3-beta-glucuronosyltransferase 1-like [Acipenser ruthenus]|uniref:galactosylgalactosylxylosylprotein 3-beta-glucuronosyltransferase 1-like n=1 Tax=Acipenser ruthenus TaxID=7906 RepID=UPI00145B453D|nr:galactosylgalactosylxylosylprotein 3-beta-glucuronosyltransferase 1-like [Acipenser ruthenus]XP_034779087.1 galactosylgalactosylxylosylprotein 3-beta-glucuronosyltransferase 1-like [Acipenser ruthenus]
MPRRRSVLTTLLIVLPWTILLTIWHQNPATRYLTILRKETYENSSAKSLQFLINVTKIKEEQHTACTHQQEVKPAQQTARRYVYSRPPGWSRWLPTIYVITPTYTRPVQKAELTRLANTFLHVPNLHWIVVEDSPRRTNLVDSLLERSGLNFTHLNVESPKSVRIGLAKDSSHTPRGTLQRNLGLRWLRENLILSDSLEGVVYFADDDNTYSLELFEEMRSTQKVSVWPVAFVGGLRYEAPKVNTAGKVVGWKTVFDPNRPFAIDMAGFAINIRLVIKRPWANFQLSGVKGGYQETSLLKELVTIAELEPKAANCTKVLVWHTRTEKPTLVNEGRQGFTDLKVEV